MLGTRNDNVTKNINKWSVSKRGERMGYEGKHSPQRKIEHDTHHDLTKLEENGIHAQPVSEKEFPSYLENHEYVFANFYAPWCIWCQRLEPIWEAFAEQSEVDEDTFHVSIVKVDCVANRRLCTDQRIQAFPTLRMFYHQKAQMPDYRGDRTVEGFMDHLRTKMSINHHIASLPEESKQAHREMHEVEEHPGCLLVGFLLVNRVPGNFHIESRSAYHNLNPAMANLSHTVNSLSFGPSISRRQQSTLDSIPEEFFPKKSLGPMNGNDYVIKSLHTAWHHYIKVVSTHVGKGFTSDRNLLAYQMVESSQIMNYDVLEVPEARFSYDLSPMAVVIEKKGKRWYEFITSIAALIGGTFTVVGLISSFLGIVLKAGKKA